MREKMEVLDSLGAQVAKAGGLARVAGKAAGMVGASAITEVQGGIAWRAIPPQAEMATRPLIEGPLEVDLQL